MGRQAASTELADRDPALLEVLARIRDELVDLGRCAEDLQTTIGAIVTKTSTPLDLDSRMGLQAADALSQRLGRLAQLVVVLEVGIPENWTLTTNLKATNDLRHAVARLSGAGAASLGRPPGDQGECDFF